MAKIAFECYCLRNNVDVMEKLDEFTDDGGIAELDL